MYVQQVNTWSCIKEWKKRNFFLNTRIYLFLCFYQVNERKLIREITSIFIKWLYSFNHFYFLSPFHKKTTRNVEEIKKKLKVLITLWSNLNQHLRNDCWIEMKCERAKWNHQQKFIYENFLISCFYSRCWTFVVGALPTTLLLRGYFLMMNVLIYDKLKTLCDASEAVYVEFMVGNVDGPS